MTKDPIIPSIPAGPGRPDTLALGQLLLSRF
jgi:hypothetical protein